MSIQNTINNYFHNFPVDTHGVDLIEFENIIASEKKNKYFFLDIRNEKEFGKLRITGSVNIPLNKLTNNFNKIPKRQKVLVICKTGFTSAQASVLLNLCGYKALTLREGIEGYIDMGGEVEFVKNN